MVDHPVLRHVKATLRCKPGILAEQRFEIEEYQYSVREIENAFYVRCVAVLRHTRGCFNIYVLYAKHL